MGAIRVFGFATLFAVTACSSVPRGATSIDGSSAEEGATDGGGENDARGVDPSRDAATSPADGGAHDASTAADSGETDASDASAAPEAGDADPCGPGNSASVPLPIVGTGTFNVLDYKAVGDGTTVDTNALQATLDAAKAADGGVVVVPPGTYLSGPLTLGSSTRLVLVLGATLKMLPMSDWPGTTPFISADAEHDVAISGAGTIEGQGQAWWNALTADASLVRPQEVVISNSTRVQIAGIRLQNSPEEHIWVKGDTDVTVTGITIETLAVAGEHFPNNTDGVDIGATSVFFCGNSIACGDDNVVMEGSGIYVGYSSFGVGHGCSIGSITKSGVSNVTVEYLTLDGTTTGIRLKSARDRGGLVEGIHYSHVTMTNVPTPVMITSYYPELPTDPTADPGEAVTATTPEWQNITLTDVKATGSTNGGIIWGLPEAKVEDLVFDAVSIEATTGMDVYHASGVSFSNGSIVTAAKGASVTTFDALVSGIATTPYP